MHNGSYSADTDSSHFYGIINIKYYKGVDSIMDYNHKLLRYWRSVLVDSDNIYPLDSFKEVDKKIEHQ